MIRVDSAPGTSVGRPGQAAGEREIPASVHGAILFARYAYPPNELGYCGPSDHRALLDYGAQKVVDPGLVQLAQGFAGAWPYLEFIARASGVGNPLDPRVVEAYWLGGPLLDTIDLRTFGNAMRERFRGRAGSRWQYLAEAIPHGAAPDHSFHVFGVYPWVGLLHTGRAASPLDHLDRCRIRWGRVASVDGDEVTVESRPLTYDGHDIGLGPPRIETARRSVGGTGFLDALAPGDWVSLHWGWVCDRLGRRELALLRRSLARQLEITNRRVAHSGPRQVIG